MGSSRHHREIPQGTDPKNAGTIMALWGIVIRSCWETMVTNFSKSTSLYIPLSQFFVSTWLSVSITSSHFVNDTIVALPFILSLFFVGLLSFIFYSFLYSFLYCSHIHSMPTSLDAAVPSLSLLKAYFFYLIIKYAACKSILIYCVLFYAFLPVQ